MIGTKTVAAIKLRLFSEQSATIFTILDGAAVPDLPANLATFNPEHICLYRGELEPDMAEVAPYLVILERDAPFTDMVLSWGWGEHWGIFGRANAGLQVLRNHFRFFTKVYDKNEKSFYFRYYDPRVMVSYLPTCNAEELKILFGPVLWYLVEESPKTGTRLTLKNNELLNETVMLG